LRPIAGLFDVVQKDVDAARHVVTCTSLMHIRK
jgi:hypothetical protein